MKAEDTLFDITNRTVERKDGLAPVRIGISAKGDKSP